MEGLRDSRWSLVKHFKASTYKKKKGCWLYFHHEGNKIFILKITVQWDPSVTLNTSQRHGSTFVNQRKNDFRFIFPVLVQYWLKVTMVSCRYSLIGRSEPVSVGLNLCRTVSKQSVQEEIGMVPQCGAQREGQNVSIHRIISLMCIHHKRFGSASSSINGWSRGTHTFQHGQNKEMKMQGGAGRGGTVEGRGDESRLCVFISV